MQEQEPLPINQTLHFQPSKDTLSPSFNGTLNEKPSSFSLQKAGTTIHEEYREEHDVHPKADLMTSFRMLFSTTDRCVYMVVMISNLGVFLWVCSLYRHPENKLLNALWIGLPVMGNLFAGSQDPVMNLVFSPLALIPTSWPLFLRRIAAGFLAVETIHAATSIAGFIWILLLTGHITREVIKGGPTTVPTLIVTYVILAMLVVMLVLCLPVCQRVMQSKFVYTHRFIAWTALVIVWAQIAILDIDYKPKTQTLGQFWLTAPPFWMFLILTVSTVIPWANSRKVKCETEVMSDECIRLHLDGSALYLGPRVPGAFARLSTGPLVHWYIYPMFFDKRTSEKGYSFVIPRTDNWSAHLIENPPKEIWTRGIITTGVMRIAPLFRRVVVIATGTGISIPAPHILSYNTPTKLLWVGHSVRETYGEDFVERVCGASGGVVHDLSKQGQLDIVASAREIVKEFNPEAVFIFSSPKQVKAITIDLIQRGGVAVYGTACC